MLLFLFIIIAIHNIYLFSSHRNLEGRSYLEFYGYINVAPNLNFHGAFLFFIFLALFFK